MFENCSVLVVDDEVWTQRLLVKIIKKIGITTVFVAGNGLEAINVAIKEKPDIIFLDMIMPEMDGATALKTLKAMEFTQHIPVIIVTGDSKVDTLGAVVAAGASDYIVKPFTQDTIATKLVKSLKSLEKISQANAAGNYSHKDFIDSGKIEMNTDKDNFEDEFVSKFDIETKDDNSPSMVEAVFPNSNSTDSVNRYKQDVAEYSSDITRILKK